MPYGVAYEKAAVRMSGFLSGRYKALTTGSDKNFRKTWLSGTRLGKSSKWFTLIPVEIVRNGR